MAFCVKCGNQEPDNLVGKYCNVCGHEQGQPIAQSTNQAISQNSKLWYLLPILFSFLGGIIMWAVLRKQNKKMAQIGLIVGFAMIIPNLVVGGLVGGLGSGGFTFEETCEDIQWEIDWAKGGIPLAAMAGDKGEIEFYKKHLNEYLAKQKELCS